MDKLYDIPVVRSATGVTFGKDFILTEERFPEVESETPAAGAYNF